MALFVPHRLFISQKKFFKNYQSLKEGKNLLQFLLSIFKHDISSYIWIEFQTHLVRNLNQS